MHSDNSKDLERDKDAAPLLVSSPVNVEIPVPAAPVGNTSNHWVRKSKSTASEGFRVFTLVPSLLPSVASVLISGSSWATQSWLWCTPWPACSPGCLCSRYLWQKWTLARCAPSCLWPQRTSRCANWKRYSTPTLAVHAMIPNSSRKPKLFSCRLAVRAEFCSAVTEQLTYITTNTLFMESIFLLSVSFFVGSWFLKNILKCQNISFIPFSLSPCSLQTSCHS